MSSLSSRSKNKPSKKPASNQVGLKIQAPFSPETSADLSTHNAASYPRRQGSSGVEVFKERCNKEWESKGKEQRTGTVPLGARSRRASVARSRTVREHAFSSHRRHGWKLATGKLRVAMDTALTKQMPLLFAL
jgi:hypothetical protein